MPVAVGANRAKPVSFSIYDLWLVRPLHQCSGKSVRLGTGASECIPHVIASGCARQTRNCDSSVFGGSQMQYLMGETIASALQDVVQDALKSPVRNFGFAQRNLRLIATVKAYLTQV